MSSTKLSAGKVIYDFGSNNGDDLPYYLKKADLVVAVEANPSLAREIERRFAKEIADGRLILENCVLTAGVSLDTVPFYIHKFASVMSQFPKPKDDELGSYEEVTLAAKAVLDIIKQYGDPYFIKIDLEHYDAPIVRELLEHGIRPPFISAEFLNLEVFDLLLVLGKYESFNLVDGETVSRRYRDHTINSDRGKERYSFPHHSAGPFGEDINGAWMTPDNFFRLLGLEGLGWKDIHATTVIPPNAGASPKLRVYVYREIVKKMRSLTPMPVRKIAGRIVRRPR